MLIKIECYITHVHLVIPISPFMLLDLNNKIIRLNNVTKYLEKLINLLGVINIPGNLRREESKVIT